MTEIGVPDGHPAGPAEDRLGRAAGARLPGLAARRRTAARYATGADGRLWIRFPGNMVGYWNNPAATAETVVDGWLDTGDVMSADADGYLWFHGRQKQIIIHDGSNICPQEVEAALLEHDAVSSAGVVGVQDPCTARTCAPTSRWTRARRDPRCRTSSASPAPGSATRRRRRSSFLDEMPLNATGKVDRVTLKTWRRRGNSRTPVAADATETLYHRLQASLDTVETLDMIRATVGIGFTAAGLQE